MEDEQRQSRPFWRTPIGIAVGLVAGAVSVYLYVAHNEHLFAALPLVLLAACPLMHLFMHTGHGANAGQSHGRPPDAGQDKRDAAAT